MVTVQAELTALIMARWPGHVLRVALDGPDAAGKTSLADALAVRLAGQRHTIRISVDGFHRPRAERLRRGDLSPEGYYQDSFDYDALRRLVLAPLGPDGDRWYRPAVFDHRSDTAVTHPPDRAPADAVLLLDGVFLQRPELRDLWDLRVFVDVDPDEAVRRAETRDAGLLGGPEAVRERYRLRYLPGQQIYRERCSPTAHADIVIDNTDLHHPAIIQEVRRGG